MKRKLIVTVLLVWIALYAPLSVLSQDFQMNGTVLVKYNGRAANVTIPAGVTAIGDSAFNSCYSLASVSIPNSVTIIGDYAFASCTSLASVSIGNGVTSIGDDAFGNCTSLTSITVAANNPNYASESGILYNKTKTTLILVPQGINGSITIPTSVTSIRDSAFYYCSSLTSISIPNSVTSIEVSIFSSCSSLTSITVAANNPNYTSEGGILYNKAKTTLIKAPQGISGSITIPTSVTSIGDSAFLNCTSLTSITIPTSVTSIGNTAFAGCASLTSISIPTNVTSIGPNTFYHCSSLTSITIPTSVTSIGFAAFFGCSSLASVTFKGTVSNFSSVGAFYGNLESVYRNTGPGTYTTANPDSGDAVWRKQ